MRRIGPILISLALLHVLLTAPLLVECVPANGQSILEMVGDDPCHGTYGASKANPGRASDPSSAFGKMAQQDPCADLALDELGCLPSSVDFVISPPRMTDSSSQAPQPGMQTISVDNTCLPGREVPYPIGISLPSTLPIRI